MELPPSHYKKDMPMHANSFYGTGLIGWLKANCLVKHPHKVHVLIGALFSLLEHGRRGFKEIGSFSIK